ncbi:unnamed protein product [Laminaria digitata]
MVATSKGYRPPPVLLDAFLRVVYETSACPVRDTTDSCFFNGNGDGYGYCNGNGFSIGNGNSNDNDGGDDNLPASFEADEFAAPHPKDLLFRPGQREAKRARAGDSATADDAAATEDAAADDEIDAAIACCRRSLLMRASYGGMPFDQALLKGTCLAWGERSGHCTPSPARASDRAAFSGCCGGGDSVDISGGSSGNSGGGGGGGGGAGDGADKGLLPPSPPRPPPPPVICNATAAAGAAFCGTPPFGYVRERVVSSWERGGWTGFLAAAHAGAGMPEALRWQLMKHVVGGGGGRGGTVDGAKRAPGSGSGGDGAGGGGGADTKNKVEVAVVVVEKPRGPILREEDAILSGVDFHCSSVLDDLLRSTALAARVGKALHATTTKAAAATAAATATATTTLGPSRRFGDPGVGVKEAAKQAMWACSSGLNVRNVQVAFSPGGRGGGRERISGRNGGCVSGPRAYLKGAEAKTIAGGGVEEGALCGGADVSETDARVWAALSPDVLNWTRRFVRARLAPGAINNNS